MFLWARLVLDVLASEVYDGQGMRAAVDIIPRELNDLWVVNQPCFYKILILVQLFEDLGSYRSPT